MSFNASNIESGCIQFIPGSHKTTAVHELRPGPEPTGDFDPVCIEMMDQTLARFHDATNNKISAGGKS